jgi:outer membrane lipoprotein-sorting protein
MSASGAWDRAAALPVPAHSTPRPEVVALGGDLPSVEALFTFMRDAELRFTTLRTRIENRAGASAGEATVIVEVTLRHPGEAKVLTSHPDGPGYEVWLSDGETVRTFASSSRVGTRRPVRRGVRGLAAESLPNSSRVYMPRTDLPSGSIADVFLHPAGYCQNVLATGACRVAGTTTVAGREAIVLECLHPRTIERVGDRSDFAIRIAVDRRDGVILRLEESIGETVTRDAVVTSYTPDAVLPPGAFDFAFPPDTTFVY